MKKEIFEKLKEAFEQDKNQEMLRHGEAFIVLIRSLATLDVLKKAYNELPTSNTDSE